MALLDMLTVESASVVSTAYSALRALASIRLFDSPDYGAWPNDYRGDVQFLNYGSSDVFMGEPIGQADFILHLHALEGSDFSIWISTITSLLAGFLGKGLFYMCLIPVLRTTEVFAKHALPVLVHVAILDSQSGGIAKDAQAASSKYFNELLSSDPTHLQSSSRLSFISETSNSREAMLFPTTNGYMSTFSDYATEHLLVERTRPLFPFSGCPLGLIRHQSCLEMPQSRSYAIFTLILMSPMDSMA